MPLFTGKKNIGRNIETEEAHGKPHKQAIAIAMNVARKGGADIPPAKSKRSEQISAIKRKKKQYA